LVLCAVRTIKQTTKCHQNHDVALSVFTPTKGLQVLLHFVCVCVCVAILLIFFLQTTLAMFRTKNFMVRRRFSDFLGLYEKLTDRHAPAGFIVPPPPEKSILGK